MGRKLAYTVHVQETAPVDPKNPDGEKYFVETHIFERGTELPDWAKDSVGDHAFEPEDIPAEVAPNGSRDAAQASGAAPQGSGEEVEAPAGNASLEAWQEYARSKGASDDDLDGKGRDDLRDAYGK